MSIQTKGKCDTKSLLENFDCSSEVHPNCSCENVNISDIEIDVNKNAVSAFESDFVILFLLLKLGLDNVENKRIVNLGSGPIPPHATPGPTFGIQDIINIIIDSLM